MYYNIRSTENDTRKRKNKLEDSQLKVNLLFLN